MQILPNGKLQISNSETGEVKQIDPSESESYGISSLLVQDLVKGKQGITTQAQDIINTEKGISPGQESDIEANRIKLKQDTAINLATDAYKRGLDAQKAGVTSRATAKRQGGVLGFVENAVGGQPLAFSFTDPNTLGQSKSYKTYDEAQADFEKAVDKYKVANGEAPVYNTGTATDKNTTDKKQANDWLGTLAKNFGSNAKEIGNALLNIPAESIQAIQDRVANNEPIDVFSLSIAGGGTFLKGLVNEYNQALGEPLKGGDIVSRIGQRAYSKPLSTFIDVLPFVLKGKVAEATQGTNDLIEGGLPKIENPILAKGGDISQMAEDSKVARSVGTPIVDDIAENTNVLKSVVKMTNTNDPTEVALQLKKYVDNTTPAMRDWYAKEDVAKPITFSQEDLANHVENELVKDTKISPDLRTKVIKWLKEKISEKPTNVSINDTRMAANQASTPYFKGGGTMQGNAQVEGYAYSKVSDILRKVQTSMNPAVDKVLSNQKVAMTYYPYLSEKILTGGTKVSGPFTYYPRSMMYRMIGKTIQAMWEPIDIAKARSYFGGYQPEGILPEIGSSKPPTLNTERIPLPNPGTSGVTGAYIGEPGTTVPYNKVAGFQSKNPSTTSIHRDMRTKQGNFQPK